jgi:hypothetical protein
LDLTLKRFDGNAPRSSQLNTDGCVLFCPNKFNLRHVDAVLRWVTTDSYSETCVVPSGISEVVSSSNVTKKRKTVTNTESKQVATDVTLFAIQITLQTPTAHKGSLHFLEGDAQAYTRNGETALHYFMWVVQEQSSTPECNRDDVKQHVSVIHID